jgi:putative ABC transport system permease protein
LEPERGCLSGTGPINRECPVSGLYALFLKLILDEDANVEKVVYADSWYQRQSYL